MIALSAGRTVARFGATARVLTRRKHLRNMDAALRAEALHQALAVEPVEVPRVLEKILRDGSRLHSVVWHIFAWKRVRRLLASSPDALVHHVTFASDVLPSAVHLLGKSVRTVWGPVGSSDVHSTLGTELPRRLRALIPTLWFRLLASQVTVVVCQTTWVRDKLGATKSRRVVEQNCIVNASEFSYEEVRDRRRVLYVGRLIARKQPELAIAAARASAGAWSLVLLGEGPLRRRLEAENADLVRRGIVRFAGQVDRAEVRRQMSRASGMLHTSRREGAPWAVAEAITAGLWVVTLRGNGADALVAEVPNSGRVVESMGSNVSAALGQAVSSLIQSDHRVPRTSRWAGDRFDSLLAGWYGF